MAREHLLAVACLFLGCCRGTRPVVTHGGITRADGGLSATDGAVPDARARGLADLTPTHIVQGEAARLEASHVVARLINVNYGTVGASPSDRPTHNADAEIQFTHDDGRVTTKVFFGGAIERVWDLDLYVSMAPGEVFIYVVPPR